jgi:glutamate-5-semialdehyde dehydrogenase
MSDLKTEITGLASAARGAYRVLAAASTQQKNQALTSAAAAIRARAGDIQAANKKDMDAAAHLNDAMRDRLMLDAKRIEAMARGVEQVAALADPVGRVLEAWDVKENGLHIEKRAVPLGVIGMIYESRPNVTADAAAIALKAGNAVILRGGSDSFHSASVIAEAMREGLRAAKLPEAAVQLVPTQDRDAVGILLNLPELIDVIIPRGGKSLTERVGRESRVPTLLHLDGNCHIYVDAKADLQKAVRVVHNAKMRRTGICGALESLLVDRAALESHGPAIITDLLDAGCEVRGDGDIQKLDGRVKAATQEDWSTEYLAPILSAKVVDGVDAAIAHINSHGSHHTDAIITEDDHAAQQFVREVDSAIVLINASTQFADGGEFGFGAEIGIATGRLHARGPVGAAQLTTYKYVLSTAQKDGAIRAG